MPNASAIPPSRFVFTTARRWSLLFLAGCGFLPVSPFAATVGPWSLTVRAENDLPANVDRYYSNGVSLAFARCVHDDDAIWPRLLRLPGLNRPGQLAQGVEIGQIMVTPADTQLTSPDPADRPYAGLLYVAMSWQRFDERHYTALKFITGVVGPESLAEQTQKAVHRTIGVPQPRGWDHQLRTEPILNAVYERRWRAQTWGRPEGWGGDLLLVGGVMLGNVLTQAHGQIQFRHGWRVSQDFGASLIRGIGALPPARDHARWGIHGYAGLGGLAIARNITLDGNSFRSGPRVSRRPYVPAVETGLVVRGSGWQATASWVVWGREFTGQFRRSEFGALAFTVFR